MTEFSYQLFSSRNWPLADTTRMIADLGYTQAEGYGGLYADLPALKAALDDAGLTMPSGHFALDMVEDDPARVIDICQTLGTSMVFVPFIGPDARPFDAAGWTALGQRLEQAAAPLIKAGLVVGWHNHAFEYAPLPTGELPMDLMLAAAPSLKVELDVAWVVRAGLDPVTQIRKLGRRIVAVHLKDLAPEGEKTDEEGWADFGTGTMGWDQIIAAIRAETAAAVFVAEHDQPSDHSRFAAKAIANARAF